MRSSSPPICTHCQSTKSPLWRRGSRQEVLCNACGLYWKHHGTYRPLSLKVAADRKNENESKIGGFTNVVISGNGSGNSNNNNNNYRNTSSTSNNNGSQRRASVSTYPSHMNYFPAEISRQFAFRPFKPALDFQSSTSIPTGPYRTASLSMAPVTYGTVQPNKLDLYQQRLNLQEMVKLPPLRSSCNFGQSVNMEVRAAPVLPSIQSVLQAANAGTRRSSLTEPLQIKRIEDDRAASTVPPLKFIIHNSITCYQGDHVVFRGEDGNFYFGILVDFWVTEHGQKFFKHRWLLPKTDQIWGGEDLRENLRPERFYLGPFQDRLESLQAVVDVFYSPYKNGMTTSLVRSQLLNEVVPLTFPVTPSEDSDVPMIDISESHSMAAKILATLN